MKAYLLTIFLLAASFNIVNAQYSLFVKDDKYRLEQLPTVAKEKQLSKYDFSKLFTYTDNSSVYGFIGSNYQRIRIKFISVTKDSLMQDTYNVYGKSMVKGNIDEFNGTIVITKIFKQKAMSYGVDDEYKNKGFKGEFILSGFYILAENKEQNHTGIFKGTFRSAFYLDRKNIVHYDDIDNDSDGYTNNLFAGNWTDYKTQLSKKCNWGDYRIPDSGDLDVGAGDFSPDEKYVKYGWQAIRNNKWWK